jgi:hypothetical protein
MKKTSIFLTLILTLCLIFLPTQHVAARGLHDGPVIFGGSYTLKSGDTLDGDLVIFGGTAMIEEGAKINGDVALFGGSLTMNGMINGDVVLMGGAALLGEESQINGDLTLVGATLSREEGSQVNGEITYSASINTSLPFLSNSKWSKTWRTFPPIYLNNPAWAFGGILGRTLAMALLALLVALFLAEPTRRVGKTITTQPVISGRLGFLTIILAPFVILALVLTILLIPFALFALLALMVALLYGWIALGFEVGRRISTQLKQNWQLPASAAFGTGLLTLISASFSLIPCIGWLVPYLIATLALGGVIISRFGMLSTNPPAPTTGTVITSLATPEEKAKN